MSAQAGLTTTGLKSPTSSLQSAGITLEEPLATEGKAYFSDYKDELLCLL